MTEKLILDFDTAETAPRSDFAPLPPGEYVCDVATVELRDTRDRTGQRLSVGLRVVEGDSKGRMLFDSINVINKSEQAQQIGRAQLAALLDSAGIAGERDMAKLVERTVRVRVSVESSDKYGDQNRVKGYRSATVAASSSSPATTAQPERKARGWMR